jgi:hypothetical protein
MACAATSLARSFARAPSATAVSVVRLVFHKGHSKPPERDPVITDFPAWLGSTIARYRYGDGRKDIYTDEMSG